MSRTDIYFVFKEIIVKYYIWSNNIFSLCWIWSYESNDNLILEIGGKVFKKTQNYKIYIVSQMDQFVNKKKSLNMAQL